MGWLDKKVFISTKSGKVFTGVVIEETKTNLTIKDKFSHNVLISKDELALLKEEFDYD
jgi:small nuclear ribonucleoprotein (snRNP)-like protein